MVTEADFCVYKLDQLQLDFAAHHAKLMAAGARTYSFKDEVSQSEDVYKIGKIGELAVYKWLKLNNVEIVHKPFRKNYQRFDKRDDFQVLKHGNVQQIEVRCKSRNFFPANDWLVCSDCIKPGLDYVFASYNKQDNTVIILGWANFATWSKYGEETLKGTQNKNFVHKVSEFNLQIKNLNKMNDYYEQNT